MTATRGTTNTNDRGSAETRRRRRAWLVATYRADVREGLLVRYVGGPADRPDLARVELWIPRRYRAGRFPRGPVTVDGLIEDFADDPAFEIVGRVPLCRCYRCGALLHAGVRPTETDDGVPSTVTVDRIIPGCRGGTYRRDNIRPACTDCNSETGGATRGSKR